MGQVRTWSQDVPEASHRTAWQCVSALWCCFYMSVRNRTDLKIMVLCSMFWNLLWYMYLADLLIRQFEYQRLRSLAIWFMGVDSCKGGYWCHVSSGSPCMTYMMCITRKSSNVHCSAVHCITGMTAYTTCQRPLKNGLHLSFSDCLNIARGSIDNFCRIIVILCRSDASPWKLLHSPQIFVKALIYKITGCYAFIC